MEVPSRWEAEVIPREAGYPSRLITRKKEKHTRAQLVPEWQAEGAEEEGWLDDAITFEQPLEARIVVSQGEQVLVVRDKRERMVEIPFSLVEKVYVRGAMLTDTRRRSSRGPRAQGWRSSSR